MNLPPLSAAKLHPITAVMRPPYPHMQLPECEFIESFLEPYHTMLEWGSGHSTIRFSQQVAEYYSIEHDKEWYDKIKAQVGSNVHYFYVKGVKFPGPEERRAPSYKSTRWHQPATNWHMLGGSLRDKQFYNYIRAVKLMEQVFDIVFIDGRARCECAKMVIPFIHPKTLIFFHNWNRQHYHIILKQYELIKRAQTMAMFKLKGA